MDLLEYLLTIITTAIASVVVFLLGRSLSQRIEESAQKRRRLMVELDVLTRKLKQLEGVIENKDKEIAILNSELEKREGKIAELQEKLKFAERDYERLQAGLKEVLYQIRTVREQIAKMQKRGEG